jgi:plastocyanin
MRLHTIGLSALIGLVSAFGPALLGTAPADAADAPVFRLTLKNNRFEPSEITVPAGERFQLIVINSDKTPAEFESKKLGVEKVVSAGREAIIKLGPLTAGRYEFVDEFHEATAKGVLVVKSVR